MRHSDATRERVAHVGGPLLLTALALGVSSYITDPAITMVVLTVAAIGIFCTFAVFWTLPTAWLFGTAGRRHRADQFDRQPRRTEARLTSRELTN